MNALIDAAIDRARTVVAALVLILIAGAYAYVTIPKEADPDVQIPILFVNLGHDGISPADAERLLIRPMEQELRDIEGVDVMRSTAFLGGANIVLEFDAGFDADLALADVREKVDLAKPGLPEDADEPTVHEVNLGLFPVLVVTLSGDLPERALLGLARDLRDDIEGITAAKAMGRSLLLGDTGAPACPYMGKSFYAQAYEREEPLVVGDLTSCEVCTGFEHYLKELGFRTLVLAPLRYEGKLIGMLELAVPRPNAINGLLVTKLGEAISLFATAMKRTLDEQDDRVQAIIKEHYTAIHPAVEWRFQQAAQTYLDLQATDRMAQIEPVVFNDVYPLYGLSDIRNSSSMRNKAIQDDLLEQLNLAHNVIVEAAIYRPLPVLDQISFRISQYADRIDEGASTEDETTILDFLQRDVESLFDRLATFGERVKERVEVYQAALDADLGVLYKKRHDFEESVTRLNDTVSAYLNEQEVHAQEMFPHYFELFKTDGVDYNIYVGASLVAPGPLPVTNKDIELLYLRNMRLWQLMAMCGIEWELRKLKPTLKMPLDATHLILVQSVPLSIRFRMEEKQFDVDGAYNIRYEIVKKRIDKAVIQGTQERLTQPHKIAIVYSQTKDAIVYRRYLDYLKAAGYITGEIEDFDLEPMQGVYGLKALRVTVSEAAPESSFHIEPAKIQTATKKLAVSA